MNEKKRQKPMPLWAIWLISLVTVLAWSAVNGEPQAVEPVAARSIICS